MTRPDLIIPFIIPPEKVKSIVQKWLQAEMLDDAEITMPDAVYLPFWVMKGTASGIARTGNFGADALPVRVSATAEIITDNETYTDTHFIDPNQGRQYMKGAEGNARVTVGNYDHAAMLEKFAGMLRARAVETGRAQLGTHNISMAEPEISGLAGLLLLVPIYKVNYVIRKQAQPVIVLGDSGKVIGNRVRPGF